MNGLDQAAVAAGVFIATFVGQLPLHELAHVLAGWAVGLRIVGVEIGSGRLLIRRRFGAVTWRLHLVPFGGETLAVPAGDARFVRLRLWLFTAAGPLLDLSLVAVLWNVAAALGRPGAPAWPAIAAALACTFRAAASLLPSAPTDGASHGGRDGGREPSGGSDGQRLFEIPFMTADQVAALRAAGANKFGVKT